MPIHTALYPCKGMRQQLPRTVGLFIVLHTTSLSGLTIASLKTSAVRKMCTNAWPSLCWGRPLRVTIPVCLHTDRQGVEKAIGMSWSNFL